jgi:glucokinase
MATSSDSGFVIGIDLGGTNMVAAAVSRDGGRVVGQQSEPTRAAEGAEAVVGRMAQMVARAQAAVAEAGGAPDAVIGIGVVEANNIKWYRHPLAAHLGAATGLPVRVDNDANCATYGEWWLGAARGGRNVIGVTIGTGIGGGIIIDRHLYLGSTDAAGEIGHITIEANGRRCSCGNYGCLEAYASGTAIAERAREALRNAEPSQLLAMAGGDPARITAATVYQAAAQGDAVAAEVVRDTARFLGAGIASLVNIFNPDVVVLAGGVTQAGEGLFAPLRTEVRRRAFKSIADAARIVPGTLPGTAGVVGAAASFIAQYTGHPPA